MRTSRLISASVLVATTGFASAGFVGATAPDSSANDVLNTPELEQLIAEAENGAVECAAQEMLGGTLLVIGFATMDDSTTSTGELGSHPLDFLLAVYAPIIVPLLDRAAPPSDETDAQMLAIVHGELTAALDEMRQLGLSDDDLVTIQTGMINEQLNESMDPQSSGPMPEPYSMLLDHDFESITFLDPDGSLAELDDADSDPTQLWADVCPETAALFNFEMEPIDVTMEASVIVGGSEPEPHIEVTVNGSEVPVETNG